jgi:Zn-dependent protease with chaperone function
MAAKKLSIAINAIRRAVLFSLVPTVLLAGPDAPVYGFRNSDHASRQTGGERDLQRLRRIMIPLLQATDHPRPNEIRVKIVADGNINAGSAGGGEFLITTGLLQKAKDDQLRGVLAHEIAHDDLGHPAKMQLVGTGLSLGAALLEKVFPASSAVAPIAGTLIASSYSRPQELEADRHGSRSCSAPAIQNTLWSAPSPGLCRSKEIAAGGFCRRTRPPLSASGL